MREKSLFGWTVFLGAFLLFLVEPMAAKGLLPVLGGSSAVWVTCLVFFQAMLLLGYLYAHWLTSGGASLRWIHLDLLGLGVMTLAVGLRDPGIVSPDAAGHPLRTIFGTLGFTIGLPFLILGSTSPLLQVWMARTEQKRGVPYGFFALSNVGSLLGLIAYPIAIEPFLTLPMQRLGWAVGFAVYAGLAGFLALTQDVWKREKSVEAAQAVRAAGRTKIMWFLLPMGAALQLAAVTSHLTVNIAAIPLLWMLPLVAYLVSFVLAFQAPELYRRGLVVRLLVVMMAALGYALTKTELELPISVGIPFFLLELFAACLFCHAEVYRLRPSGRAESTLFYLCVAGGGVLGTFLVAVVSPLVFRANYDLAISFLVTALLALGVTWNDGWGQRLLWGVGSSLLLVLVVMLYVAYGRGVLEVERNFYGTLRVTQKDSPAGPVRTLANGTIQHGTQIFPWMQPGLERVPTTYYAENSGVGLALRSCCAGRGRRVGVIGLGVGTIAAYGGGELGRPGDMLRFYEINPLVRSVAGRWFTYLRDTRAAVTYADGDGRTSLTREPAQNFDVLVVDAFSGDAIPLHLLTVEAMQEYRRHLAEDGVLAFHISNQYLKLAPEIECLAASAGMEARLFDSGEDQSRGEFRATWVLVSARPEYFERDDRKGRGSKIVKLPGLRAWTDDYSSLLPVVDWGSR